MRSFFLLSTILLAAASEALAGNGNAVHDLHPNNGLKHARMLRRRGLTGGNSNNPCRRNTTKTSGSNIKVVDATSNLTAWISKDGQEQSSSSDVTTRSKITVLDNSDTRLALGVTTTSSRESLNIVDSSSSSSWSSPAPASSSSSVSVGEAAGSASGNGMNQIESWSGSDVSGSACINELGFCCRHGVGELADVLTSFPSHWHKNATQFESWDFFTHTDPTNGNVNYVSLAEAKSDNLLDVVDGQFKMSVSTGALVNGNRVSVHGSGLRSV